MVGVSHVYLLYLESGQRCPSVTVAEKLAEVLVLDGTEREQLLDAAVNDAGADHPLRAQHGK
ncbi:helix-turn-helix transcriptional regulator [Streptacidiphilus sp. N1-10]|uniref:Helix-turn-helix transcriptional regulator n=1 Tax=Streptacidiphilus jeojiensis TaxID=3229225 RepID=A0ABV6XLC2_9ACTN